MAKVLPSRAFPDSTKAAEPAVGGIEMPLVITIALLLMMLAPLLITWIATVDDGAFLDDLLMTTAALAVSG